MKRILTYLCLPALFVPVAIYAQAPAGKDLSWAFPVADKVQPPVDTKTLHRLPESALALTEDKIDDLMNPPDWYPNEHPTPPTIVLHGHGNAIACGSCHLMNGQGHPESAALAGLPAAYIIRQMEYFKSGIRKEPGRMNVIAKDVTDEEVRQIAAYFSAIKPAPWVKVVEAETVPKSRVTRGRMRLPVDGMEPLGNRIIMLPQDAERVEERDPHTGFIAYVPKGSVKKGEALVNNAKSAKDKTLQCAICHGEGLHGIGDVPAIAGMHPIYIVRQLYGFKTGGYNNGGLDQLMKKVVDKLTDDDILDIAAYVGSLPR